MSQARSTDSLPLLQHSLESPSAFTPERLMEAVRAERSLANEPVPRLCVLDFDGDLSDRLAEEGRTSPVKSSEIAALSATPDVLWPANKRMVSVVLTPTVTDDNDSDPACQITDVTAKKSISTGLDWIITDPLTLTLTPSEAGWAPGGYIRSR